MDYGEAHSREYHHERYGRDFSDCPLLPQVTEEMKLVLIGHSFGGVTARLFAHLMENGAPAEKEATQDGSLSPLFCGGLGSRIHSVTAIASSLNGNSTYTMLEDPAFDPNEVKVSLKARFFNRLFIKFTKNNMDGSDPRDCAEYDMHIDRAMEMNREIKDLPHVYYYSIPCSLTRKSKDGSYMPEKTMESVFIMRSTQIGRYTGVTKGGFAVDRKWLQNDGRVNTISEIAPFGSLKKKLLPGTEAEPGIWNVYPLYHGDHMSLQGGLRHKTDIRGFYKELLTQIGFPFISNMKQAL